MRPQKKHLLSFFVIFLFVAVTVAGGYFYWQYNRIRKNPNIIAQEETKYITGQIGKFIDIPKDEQPSLATITDVSKLKDQPFFKNAKNGDKLVVYNKAQKAILYRPSDNKIIEYAPLLTGNGQDQNAQPAVATVAIYNGTNISGLTNEVEKQLASVTDISIVSKVNAAKSDYSQSLVLDLSGSHNQLASDIAQKIGGKLTSALPGGESKPSADILIIAGKPQ